MRTTENVPSVPRFLTDDELAHPKDEGKRLFERCVGSDENCKQFNDRCGDVVLNPIVKGVFPKP
jgi:hypothetical protein